MKCLSLWQPHAEAIALGLKPFETRGWSTDFRGPLAIHAAKHPLREKDCDWNWYCEMKKRLALAGMRLEKLTYGKIVCVVDVVDCVPTAEARKGFARQIQNPPSGAPFNWQPPEAFWGDFSDRGDDGRLRFAFKLENIRKIPEAHRPELKGMQGLFNTTKKLHDELALWG
jgi:activating signal cointegrator 1